MVLSKSELLIRLIPNTLSHLLSLFLRKLWPYLDCFRQMFSSIILSCTIGGYKGDSCKFRVDFFISFIWPLRERASVKCEISLLLTELCMSKWNQTFDPRIRKRGQMVTSSVPGSLWKTASSTGQQLIRILRRFSKDFFFSLLINNFTKGTKNGHII